MSLVSLAKTVFSSGPDDKLIVLDTYKKSDSNPVNSIQDLTDEIPFDQGFDAILKGQLKPKGILDSIKQSDLVKKITADGTASRLFGQAVALKSLYQDLSGLAKGGLSLENKLKNSVDFVFGGNVSRIVSTGLNDARAIAGIVDNFTNNGFKGVFKDYGAISGFVTSVTKQATDVGLSGVFTSLSASVTDKNALICSASDLLPQAAATGNTNLFLEIANSSIAKEVKSIFPDVVSSVIKGVSLVKSIEQRDYSGAFEKLDQGFRAVDKNWDKYARLGNDISDIALNGVKLADSSSFMKLIKSNVFSKTSTPNAQTAVAQVGYMGPTDLQSASDSEKIAYNDNNNKFLLMMDQFKERKVSDDIRQMIPIVKTREEAPTLYDKPSGTGDYASEQPLNNTAIHVALEEPLTQQKREQKAAYDKAILAYVSPNIVGQYRSTGIDWNAPRLENY